jgi:hypothetical protein
MGFCRLERSDGPSYTGWHPEGFILQDGRNLPDASGSPSSRRRICGRVGCEAVRLDSQFDEAYLSRAWLLTSCPNVGLRDPKKAVASATRACELTGWHEPHDLGGLAAVYAETGDVASAVKWQSKAIELLTSEGKGGSVEVPILGHH